MNHIKIILFGFLATVTLVCHTYVDRFEKSGPEMLTGSWTQQAQKPDLARVKKNELFLFSSDRNKSVNIRQEIQSFEPGAILMLSADIWFKDVQPGKKPWNRARFLLVQNDGKKDRWDLSHLVASFTGTRGWGSYEKIFAIDASTQTLKVIAQLSQCTGSFQLKHLICTRSARP